MRHLLAATALLFLATTAFANERLCGGTAVYLYAFNSAFDQQQMLTRASLEHGAQNVQTAVAVPGVPDRYLVIVTICDAYISFPRTAGSRVAATAVVIPDDHPFSWQPFRDTNGAFAEYELHANAPSRGLASLGDGTIVVYWAK